MTTTLTPPQAPAPIGQPPTRGASRIIAILVIVFGSLVLLGTIGSAIIGTIASASVHTSSRTLAVDGVESLDVDVSAGALRIEYADVAEAELEVTSASGADRWTLARPGDRLVVESPNRFNDWLSWGWFSNGVGDAVLRLPLELEGLEADVSLSAGDLDVAGAFDSFALDLSAGSADLELADVSSASFSVSAGGVDAELTGVPPRDVMVDVSAGSVDLTVPEGDYHVASEVSAGEFDSTVESILHASNTIQVDVSAGEVVLRTR